MGTGTGTGFGIGTGTVIGIGIRTRFGIGIGTGFGIGTAWAPRGLQRFAQLLPRLASSAEGWGGDAIINNN